MFYNLILENETGQQIDLSKTANRFMFNKIEGLSPPPSTICTFSYAGMPDFMMRFAQGINKSKKYVEKAISGVADAMTIAMNSDFNVNMSGVTGAMVDEGGTTVVNNYNSRTVNQTNNSPKSLSRLEIYRMTRNALG